MKRRIRLSDDFTYGRLLRFTLPTISMMIFTSTYTVVDGWFVSNYVGKTAFAAVNLIMPVLVILACIGYMFGAGGSAIIAKTLGEKDTVKAHRLFSLFVYLSITLGIFMAILGYIFMPRICVLLGAQDQLLADCVLYGRIFILALPTWLLLYEFQLFFVTAEKPDLGLIVTVASGMTNIVLDALFIITFEWGLAGAAWASAISQLVGGLFPLIYFACPNTSLLKLTRTHFDWPAVIKCCTNGSSELMSGVAMSLVAIVYNLQLMKYVGEDGVAAYGVLLYVSTIFSSFFLGFSNGAAPLFSFNYGAQRHDKLHRLLKQSLTIIAIFSVSMFILSELLAEPISDFFVGYDPQLKALTIEGFFIYSFAYFFMGLAIFGSAFFTALNNGPVSALISFLRTLVFELGAVLLLPMFFGIKGIWGSVCVAELMAALVSVLFLVWLKKDYRY